MSEISEIFKATPLQLDSFLQTHASPEFMKLLKQLIVCILSDGKNLLNEESSQKVKNIIDIEKFKRLSLGIVEEESQYKKDFKRYKVTYSGLILNRSKLSIYRKRSGKASEFSDFLVSNPNFEEETKADIEGYEEDIVKNLEQLKKYNSPFLEDYINLINKDVERKYKDRIEEFYKSEYYSNKNFDNFLATIGEIFQEMWCRK